MIGGVGGDHVRVLIETRAAVGNNAGDSRAGLSVINPVTSTDHHLRSKLEGKAETRLEIVPIGHIVGALAGSGEHFAALQWKLTGLSVTGSI